MVLPMIVGMQLGVYFYLFGWLAVWGIGVFAPVTGHKRKIIFFVSGFLGEGVFLEFGNPFSGSGVYKR